ncbi:hypothetical protein OG417_31515 [Actinoallomurus sp. NBC_01490]|jgi:hypothetical protein|uniref:DUF6801 domain-containing protein n=1 Tax=Actinoallomurus sp. NBC_01490 TaxID=2903557 RepID=UPI002E304FDE|nr:DUF6801 domain-containing protein [Actinoallomurus sp. NBC_01490]
MRFSFWTRRGLARAAVACVIAITASLLSTIAAVAGERAVDRTFTYACQLPSGTQQVAVRVIANVPDSATAGRPIRLGNVTVLVALPAAAVAGLTKQGVTTVGGTLRMTPLVTANGSPARITGSDFAVPETSVGADQLVLAGSGQEPAPTVAAPGRVVFSVADLSASLTLRQADGTAAQPATMSLSCSPNLGQDTALTTIAVSAADATGASGPGSVSHATAAKAQEDYCPPDVTGGFSEDFPLPTPPPDTPIIETTPLYACAKISGFSNVAKLNGAAPLFGKMALEVGNRSLYNLNANYFETDSLGASHVETSQATFLAFGFMPTTAELDVTQVGKTTAYQNANITAVDYVNRSPELPPRYTTASAYVSLRIHDVRINGVPLDVGADCTTAQPMKLQLSASTNDDPTYVVNSGGFLTGTATIPPFQGCGVGESLDPLFTASLSGPGNYIRITQGQICDADHPFRPPTPCPVQDFGWDVEPGGPLTASSGAYRLTLPNAGFSCESTSFSLSLNGGKARDGDDVHIGVSKKPTFTNCHGEGALSQAATISFLTASPPFSLTTYDPTTDVAFGELPNLNITLRDGTSCTVRISGASIGFRYSNLTHVMSLTQQSSAPPTVKGVTGCGGSINTGEPVDFSANYVFSVPQRMVRPGYK